MIPASVRRAFSRKPTVTPGPTTGGPTATEADVRRAYQLLLGRPPESLAVLNAYVGARITLPDLFGRIAGSGEFVTRWSGADGPRAAGSGSDEQVIFAVPKYDGPGTAGFVTDFVGTRTRVGYVRGLDHLSGTVEGYPFPGNFHAGPTEWAGVIRSVFDAEDAVTAVELGAGWGPWLVVAAALARWRGIDDVRLVGVEGAIGHVEYLRQHFRDNDLDPDRHALLHGVAAAADGWATFPDLDDPAADYGAAVTDNRTFASRTFDGGSRVKAYSVATLLDEFVCVDLLHVDVQGSEADVLWAAGKTLNAKVRRVVVGTHGREIEQRLMEHFSAAGWQLEADEACRYRPHGDGLALAADGCQVWWNPRV